MNNQNTRHYTIFTYSYILVLILFFYNKTLLSPEAMQTLIQLPVGNPKGMDINELLQKMRSFFWAGETYDCSYAPFTAIFFYPMLLLKDSHAFLAITALTLGSALYLLYCGRPRKEDRFQSTTFSTLAPIALMSYGIQFEIERGQFNLIAMALGIFGVNTLKSNKPASWIGLLPLSMAIQLKVWPALMFILIFKNRPDPLTLIKSILGITFLSIALTFSVGTKAAKGWLNKIGTDFDYQALHGIAPSIKSFVAYMTPLLGNYASITSTTLYSLTFLLISACIFFSSTFQKNISETPYNTLAVFCGMIIITPVSYDYKLSILIYPISLLLRHFGTGEKGETCSPSGVTAFTLICLAYCATTFSYAFRPLWLTNAFPLILIILVSCTYLQVLARNCSKQPKCSALSP